MAASIEVRGLSRTFHTTVRRPGLSGALRSLVNPERVEKHAVSDITFDVAPGELLALLGPNGAGKSTTIKMLTGILTPSSGHARVAGVVPYQERERNARNITYGLPLAFVAYFPAAVLTGRVGAAQVVDLDGGVGGYRRLVGRAGHVQ
ncbi:ATP-binding cassette domain-containing protein, partial [Streptomyces sp. NPDC048279]|uniref:ATP-binding cassette domain-containing protein n=1 Tax=Streptomyces sp. NPDC048279 TaxID=3154714 RepID=UPI00341C09BD